MKCPHLAMRRGHLVGCGKCGACMANRRRTWCTRLMLETHFHAASYFVTLTYDDEHLPSDASVSRREVQLFLKRLRRAGQEVRYYAVGEYGERSGRPHYHLALFGLSDCGVVVRRGQWVRASPSIDGAWRKGHVHIGELNSQSAAYITGYISKKWTKKNAPALGGRHPEFAVMSLRPGIGAGFGAVASNFWNSHAGVVELSSRGDVTSTVRMHGKQWPLGRYLVRKIREASGYEQGTPLVMRRLLQLRDAAFVQEQGSLEALRRTNKHRDALVDGKFSNSMRKRVL